MGDKNRDIIFSSFIKRRFRDVHFILEIAGGKGILARKLANKKFRITVIESKPRFKGGNHGKIKYMEGTFSEDYSKVKCDLIIGMHPDEATSEIIRYAGKHRIPYAVVPCCHVGKDAHTIGKYRNWLNKIKSIAAQSQLTVNEFALRMNGRNIVLFGKPRGNK